MTYLPLQGVKVLDLARLIPGDLATRRLADLGADVVKFEEPGIGDYLRLMGTKIGGESVMHWCVNRNKQSVEGNIKTPEGRALFDSLAAVADVIVEVSIPGRLKRAGLDFAAMRAARPELVICSITGFGQTGQWHELPSHGMNLEALAGTLPLIERDGRSTLDFGLTTTLASEFGAVNAALAVTAAVFRAKTTGEGAWIDLSCWDTAVEIRRLGLTEQAASPEREARTSSAEGAVLYAVYKARDGVPLVFCAIERQFWTRFCDNVGRPDLIAHWQGEVGDVDFRPGDEGLRAELDDVFRTADGVAWEQRFLDWSIPGCAIVDGTELLSTKHFADRQLLETDDPRMPVLLDPIRWMEGGRPGEHAAPPPGLGEHQREVIERWLGCKNEIS